MNLNNERFMSNFERLYDFYEIKNPPEVKSFIQKNEKLFDLLDETKIHLKDKFPDRTFELEMCYDLNGEGLDLLLVNIYVDEVTFNNGFTDKILEIDMKILPIEKELDLIMKTCLIEGIPPKDKFT